MRKYALFRRVNSHQKANTKGFVEFVEQQILFLATSAAFMKQRFRLYAPVA